MSEPIVLEHARRRNIERCEMLVKKNRLNETKLQFINQRLLEQRRALAMLQLSLTFTLHCRPPQSHSLAGEPIRPHAPAVDPPELPPGDIR